MRGVADVPPARMIEAPSRRGTLASPGPQLPGSTGSAIAGAPRSFREPSNPLLRSQVLIAQRARLGLKVAIGGSRALRLHLQQPGLAQLAGGWPAMWIIAHGYPHLPSPLGVANQQCRRKSGLSRSGGARSYCLIRSGVRPGRGSEPEVLEIIEFPRRDADRTQGSQDSTLSPGAGRSLAGAPRAPRVDPRAGCVRRR